MTSPIKTFARKTGLNKLYHVLYRVPRNTVQQSIREGGPIQQWRTRRGEQAMKEAAPLLPPLSPPCQDSGSDVDDGRTPLRIHFLTGTDFWYQSLFCFYSLTQHTRAHVIPVLHDDGTLAPQDRAAVQRVVPWVEFEMRDAIEARLDEHLPRSRYPVLRERRIEYIHLRKLTDVHAGRTGWHLVLDSDMLFFATPHLLLDWLNAPDHPFHMLDSTESYGYSRELMETLAGAPIPERLNVGFCGLRSESIDWDRLEHWCGTMIEEEGYSYLQEQALTAMLVAGRPRTVAPRPDYLVQPSVEEGQSPSVTLHHYVAESKRAYFQHGWRHVAERARS